MKRYTLAIVLALITLLSAAAIAQVQQPPNDFCDSQTNLDLNGDVCTNVLFAAGYVESNLQENTFLPIVQEDGYVPVYNPDYGDYEWPGYGVYRPDFYSSSIVSGGAGLPEDPLVYLGLVDGLQYGYVHTDVSGDFNAGIPVNGPVDTGCRWAGRYSNYQWQTITYTVGNFHVGGAGYGPGNPYPPYPYSWSGQFTVKYIGHRHIGRFGYCYEQYLSDGQSWGTLSAVHQ